MFEELRNVIVVLPSLNPDSRMPETIYGMLHAGFCRVLLIDDGSDSEHKAPFAEVTKLPEVTLLTHEVNLGKGRALKDAFAYILENMPDVIGCVTVDGDAQHKPEDTVRCAEKMLETGHLTFGCRDFDDPSVPSRNRAGNKITRFAFKSLIGLPISDAQTGLRAFPRAILPAMLEIEGDRFEYESNMLLEMKRKDIPFEEVPIATVYINGNSTSHFNPIVDSYRVYKPIIKYAVGSMGSAGIDVGVFTVLNLFLRNTAMGESNRILLATVIARIISSLCNYTWNRKEVFKSKEDNKKTMARYYVLCAGQMAMAYGLTFLFTHALHTGGFGDTVIKIIVDVFLAFFSFRIQHNWVFK